MIVETSGGSLNYAVHGRGPDVILLHGIPTHSYLWRNVVPLLRGFRSVTVDLLGYGYSEKPPAADLSLTAQAKYVIELMDSLKIERACIVGHDIGGGIAQIMAASYLERVSSIILVDSAGLDYWPVPQISRLKDPAWDEIIERIDLFDGIKRGLLKGVVRKEAITDELVREYLKPFEGPEGRRAYLRAARALDFRDTMRVADAMKSMEIPSLIIWGGMDEYLPPSRGKQLAQLINKSKLLILDNVGHFSPEDDPRLIGMIIRGFLEEVQQNP